MLSEVMKRRSSFSLKSVPKLFAFRPRNRGISVKRFPTTFSNFHFNEKYWQKRRTSDSTQFDWLYREGYVLQK